MTLNDLINSSLQDILKNMDLVKVSPHSDDTGEIQSIELKYVPKTKPLKQEKFEDLSSPYPY